MYNLNLRIYLIGYQTRAYAELYEEDQDHRELLTTAHVDLDRSADATNFAHEDIVAAVHAVCDEIAGNFEQSLF